MANVFVSDLDVPKTYRNKRIYGGNIPVINTQLPPSPKVHIESGRLTDLATRNIAIYFGEVFNKTPTGWIRVYRMRQITPGKWKQQDVLYYHADEVFKNGYGFGLVIEATESLTGVVIEYFFI